ncbi:cytochrome c [Pseudooceanicola sp.]|uniref:c-type cytochrome n=1 Tax=Pseudooceanicola sp. TaxID=1914328 RepID=UPI00262AFB78|nr:cytochrome c [Pseudooceanicola sp.]MDF1854167.1 cytochrome c [Pseudooceanicola sp.]
MKKMTYAIAALVALGVSGAAIGASHADPAIAAAVKARKSVMGLYAFNLGKLGAMAKGEMAYDSAAAKGYAENLNALATLDQSSMWPAGSDNVSFADTRALPAMWENMEGAMKAGMALASATGALADAAGTDLAALQVAMGPVGAACGACHKASRAAAN